MFNWTEEAEDTLRRLDAEGVSFSQIGGVLGVSRNAAIGKARRIGCPLRLPTESRADKKPRMRRRNQKTTMRLTNHGNRFDMVEVNKIEAIDLPPEISPVAVALLDLESHHCRWPVTGDATHATLFCGAKKIDGCPYCARHARIAYQPHRDHRPYYVPKRATAA